MESDGGQWGGEDVSTVEVQSWMHMRRKNISKQKKKDKVQTKSETSAKTTAKSVQIVTKPRHTKIKQSRDETTASNLTPPLEFHQCRNQPPPRQPSPYPCPSLCLAA